MISKTVENDLGVIMKNCVLLFALTFIALTPVLRAEEDKKPDDAKALKEKFSTAIGISLAENMKPIQEDVDMDIIIKTLKDVLGGAKPPMNEQEIRQVFMAMDEIKKNAGKKEGENFLIANGKKEGVTTTASGLQYEVIKKGDGEKPTAKDTVVTKYKGSLVSGKEFDNSENHGGTAEFGVGQVIKGWTEALQLMPVGSKWKLFIPPGLAYGENAPPSIGPNQVLIFEIELVSIKK